MENTDYASQQLSRPQVERPDFLKILCILSFVCCGLWILLCAMGTTVLSFDEAAIEKVWAPMVEKNAQLEEIEPVQFMHDIGIWCICVLIANIFSLIGVVMMWRLEKIGFFIYVLAELSFYFFRVEAGPSDNGSMIWTVLLVCLDLGFIAMYLVNLKYMTRKNNTTFVQSGG